MSVTYPDLGAGSRSIRSRGVVSKWENRYTFRYGEGAEL